MDARKKSRKDAAVAEEAPDPAAPEVIEEEDAVEETPEERAARKAAKKARKEARAARRAARAAAATEDAADGGDDDDAPAAAPVSAPVAAIRDEDTSAAAGKKRRREEAHSAAGGAASASSRSFTSWPCYYEPAGVRSMSAADISSFRSEKGVAVEDVHTAAGDAAWRPITTFAAAAESFPADMMVCTRGFKEPSPIQSQCWPIVLSGRDIVGIAQTGSGKTLAFTLPALVHIQCTRAAGAAARAAGASGRAAAAPMVLVLAPTRELAMQSAKVAVEAGAPAGIASAVVYGGVPKDAQRRELHVKGGVQFMVATPGRLLDFMEDGSVDLSSVTLLVLDEADRMLDLGFEKDIRVIVAKLRSHAAGRQTLMFSATWPPSIQGIAAEFMTRPVKVTIGSAELAASHTVKQIVEVMELRDREAHLLRLLNKYHASRKNRIIIFALYKAEAGRLEGFLASRGWSVCAIHGDMSQDARTRSFDAFRDGRTPLLVATDVAARGLDIPNVEYVINFTFPLTIEDYVHRIGRTGRAGKSGIAHTMFTVADKAHAGELVNVLREAGAEVPDALLKFGTHIKKKEHSLYGAHFKADGAPTPGAAAGGKAHMKFD